MSATINAFPPLHSFTSPRSWFLAIIVLLHVGFFWALSSGFSQSIIKVISPPPTARFLDDVKRSDPPPPPPKDYVVPDETFVPLDRMPDLPRIDEGETNIHSDPPPPAPPSAGRTTPPQPVISEPRIDPKQGLSEPPYPATEIRLGHTGTTVLAVQVLENGAVGEVRLDQSSGYPRLDESAMREARRWRFKPGLKDGVPIVMWKQVPITFRLQD